MTLTLITPAVRASLARSIATRYLDGTYTRQSRVATGQVDAWNQPVVVDQPPVTGLPCHYDERSGQVDASDREGQQNTQRPTLVVPGDDPIAPGDVVSDVRDNAGRVLLAGPVHVEDTQRYMPGGGTSLMQRVWLRETEAL